MSKDIIPNPLPKFLTEAGDATTADDPQRLLWYSATCGYWTDDWSLLKKYGPGIPCCPTCRQVGMQTTAKDWYDGAVAFEADGNPGYLAFLNDHKAKCHSPAGMMAAWKRHKEGQP